MAAMETAGKPITCKAAVMWETGKPLVLEEISVEPPRAGEVRIKIVATALCHTDEYSRSGADPETNLPCILGHEAVGTVESVGEGVTNVKAGDTVVPLYTPECGTCKFCVATGSKRTNLCARIRSTQGKGVMPDGSVRFSCVKDGKRTEIKHFMGCSTFSEYTVVAAISVVQLPEGLDPVKCSLFGCGVTTGYGAVFNTAKFEAGSTAAVFGLGAVGLAVIMGLKDAGAKRVIAVDTNPKKLDKARELCPYVEFVNPADHAGQKIEDVIISMTTEEGFGGVDYSFECVGNTTLMRSALECTHRAWGKSIIIGVAAAGKEISTRPFFLVVGRTWTGTAFGGVKGRSELPGLVDKLMPHAGTFVTHTFAGIGAINDAFHVMHEPAELCIRPVITL